MSAANTDARRCMADFPNASVCEHGQLRRKCDLCQRDENVRELEAQLDALAARVSGAIELCDRLIYLVENGAGEHRPGERLRQVRRALTGDAT